MKKGKICSKLKKILITIMCVITLVFSMPVKAKAEIIGDFLNLLLKIPDAVMWATCRYVANQTTPVWQGLNLLGVDFVNDKGNIYNFSLTPYEIFSSGNYIEVGDHYYTKLGIFDINFFSDKKIESDTVVSSNILGSAVGAVYKSLRNLCMVLMMLVLLYIGIKIIISSASADQAKYKNMLVDWLVGFCLLFIMNYMMSFIVNINSEIVNMLDNSEGDSYYIGIAEIEEGWVNLYSGEAAVSFWEHLKTAAAYYVQDNAGYTQNAFSGLWSIFSDWNKTGDIAQELLNNKALYLSEHIIVNGDDKPFEVKEGGMVDLNNQNPIAYGNQEFNADYWGEHGEIYLSAMVVDSDEPDDEENNNKAICKLNLMEYTRTMSNWGLNNSKGIVLMHNNSDSTIAESVENTDDNYLSAYAFAVLYLVLVIETVIFIIQYFKRVFQLAMLTMIAPLIAFMYPIDKVGDGQAQAYNTWIKDYIFNVLIQPLHLLLYTIFIGASGKIFHKNLIYALVMYGFMIPAEKYFKKIFGFDKASGAPPGGLLGGAGGMLAIRGFDKLTGLGPHHGHKGGSGGGDKDKHKIKLDRNKLPKPGASDSDSQSPRSSGDAGSLNVIESGGRGTIGNILRNRNNSRSNSANGNRPEPTASNNPNRGKLRNLLKAGRTNMGKSFSRAITGGKYDNLRSGAALAAVGGNIAKKSAKLGGRVAGTAFLGSAGLMVGAATAIATGDVNNLSKGVSIGAMAGWNRGGDFADWASNGISNTISNIDAEWANIDEGHRARYFINEAKESFQDQQLTSDQNEVLEKFAPFVNFNGDDKKLDAYIQASKELYGEDVDISNLSTNQMYAVDSMVSDAQKYGNLDDPTNMQTYVNAKKRELQNSVKADPASVSEEEIKAYQEEAAAKQEKDIKANRYERGELEEKMNAAVANVNSEEEKKRIKGRYADRLEDLDKKMEEIAARKITADEARQQIAEQKAANDLEALISELAGKTKNTWDKTRKIKS